MEQVAATPVVKAEAEVEEEASWCNTDDPLAIRQKEYEQQSETLRRLDAHLPFIARLDGHRFSKFTMGFKKPFDTRIFEAMLATTTDLAREFQPVTAYTQSDEITLVFPAIPKEIPDESAAMLAPTANAKKLQSLMFNGKIQKMVSLMAGYCSVRFAYHMSTKAFDTTGEKRLLDKIHKAYFDARVFNLPNDTEVLWNVIWRIKDIKRNSKNNLGHHNFPHRELEGLNPTQILEKLQKEKGISWYNDMPNPYKYGVIIKKGEFAKEAVDFRTKEPIIAMRKRYMYASTNIWKPSPEAEKLIMCKLLSEASSDFLALFEPVPEEETPIPTPTN